MRNKLVETLIRRDGLTREQAEQEVEEAREAMYEYIEDGDYESAEDIMEEFFGLEPDYIDYLI